MATFTALRARLTRRLVVVLAVVIGLLAPMAVMSAADAAPVFYSRGSNARGCDWQVLHLLNSERRSHHLHRLSMTRALRRSAYYHNSRMGYRDVLSHQLPNEAFFATRISRQGYNWSWAGENIAWSSGNACSGAMSEQRGMFNEHAPFDEHRQNILSRNFDNVGIDVYYDRRHDRTWLTTDFGHRMH